VSFCSPSFSRLDSSPPVFFDLSKPTNRSLLNLWRPPGPLRPAFFSEVRWCLQKQLSHQPILRLPSNPRPAPERFILPIDGPGGDPSFFLLSHMHFFAPWHTFSIGYPGGPPHRSAKLRSETLCVCPLLSLADQMLACSDLQAVVPFRLPSWTKMVHPALSPGFSHERKHDYSPVVVFGSVTVLRSHPSPPQRFRLRHKLIQVFL